MREPLDPKYLGDSVYIKDEGHFLTISLTNHKADPILYLEPEVIEALVTYIKDSKIIKRS